jgi:hypothetical protein
VANRKKDIAQIESTLDFESVSKKLETLTDSGELRRRKTVADLLDKVQPALLRARENKVPFSALAAFLKESGIPVSEPSLRQYMNALPVAKKSRKQPVKKASKAAVVPAKSSAEPPAETPSKKRPPRLAR